MLTDEMLRRADQLIEMGKAVMSTAYSTGGQYNIDYVKDAAMAGFRSAVLSFVERIYGSAHPHYEQFENKAKGHYRSNAEMAIAILEAIRDEIAGGWLVGIKSLVSAELFADFLEMAEHLLETGYKDPAAVMGGSVLEEHLRQLCHKAGIDVEEDRDGKSVPRKADRLNAELTKVDIYTKLDQKLITAWLDLRNNAAHGKYDGYTAEQVKQMLMGVTEFMVRVPS